MSLSYLSNQAPFCLADIKQSLLAVFTIPAGSDFANKTQALLDAKKTELEGKNIKVLFVTNSGNTDSPDFVLDTDMEIINQATGVTNKKAENLVLFKLENGAAKYLIHKESPEHEYDWITVVSDFADNYFNPNPNDQNLYKWGQVVPEAGDYLCIDCGYIASFEAGDIFPVCEVCLSGEPAGPTSSDGAYWEKV
jgi:hypothetical protein